MLPSKLFLKNSFIYTVAGALPMASGILLLPIYTAFLDASLYGELALYTGFTLLIQVVITYSFDSAVYLFFHDFKHDHKTLSRYISSVFILMFLISAGVTFIFFFCGNFIFRQVYSESALSFYPYGLMSIVTGVMQGVFKVNTGLQQTQKKAAEFLKMNFVSFSLIALFTTAGLWLMPESLAGPVGGRMFAMLISGAWVLISIQKQFGFCFDFNLLKTTLWFNHPSLLYQVMQWFNGVFDRVLLTGFLPLSQVGIYDFAARCVMVNEFLIAGFVNTFLPTVFSQVALQKEKKSTAEINRYYHGLTALTIVLVCLCILILPPLIRLFVVKPAFLESIRWIPYIAITYLFRSFRFFVNMPYGALKWSKPLPIFYLIIASIKILSMLFLIPRLGIMGLIISIFIGYGVEMIILYVCILDKFKLTGNFFKLLIAPMLLTAIILIGESLFSAAPEWLVHSGYLCFAIALLLWGYRKELPYLLTRK